MTLTPAEFGILDQLTRVVGESMPLEWLKPAKRTVAKRVRVRGLLSKREFAKGMIKATAAGRRSHSYGVR